MLTCSTVVVAKCAVVGKRKEGRVKFGGEILPAKCEADSGKYFSTFPHFYDPPPSHCIYPDTKFHSYPANILGFIH